MTDDILERIGGLLTTPKPKPESKRGLPRSLKGYMPEHHLCIDCGFNTAPGFSTRAETELAYHAHTGGPQDRLGKSQIFDSETEVYYVRDHIWKAAGMKPFGGCLCIGCLEKRLGRRLRPKDFQRDHPFNDRAMPGTPRLLSRRRGAS